MKHGEYEIDLVDQNGAEIPEKHLSTFVKNFSRHCSCFTIELLIKSAKTMRLNMPANFDTPHAIHSVSFVASYTYIFENIYLKNLCFKGSREFFE